jgi:hypothetical protein
VGRRVVSVALLLEARLAVPKAKGAVLVGPVKYLRKNRDAARPILPPELTHYLDEDIRISSWYPEEDFLCLMEAAAAVAGGDLRQTMEAMGAAGANEHAGVYGDLFESMESSSSVFALWSAQHDTGEIRGVPEGKNSVRVQLLGFQAAAEVHCWLVAGYIRGVLTMRGFDSISVEKRACLFHGGELCEWRASWKDPDATPITPARRRGR